MAQTLRSWRLDLFFKNLRVFWSIVEESIMLGILHMDSSILDHIWLHVAKQKKK